MQLFACLFQTDPIYPTAIFEVQRYYFFAKLPNYIKFHVTSHMYY